MNSVYLTILIYCCLMAFCCVDGRLVHPSLQLAPPSLDNSPPISSKTITSPPPQIELPFTVERQKLSGVWGYEIRLKMKESALNAGLHDIYLGALFRRCSSLFIMYIDLRDWPNAESIYGNDAVIKSDGSRRLEKLIDLEDPRYCYYSIPFTTLCIRLQNVVVTQDNVQGSLVMDYSIGVSSFQIVHEGYELVKMSFGSESSCLQKTTQKDCIDDVECGWCNSTKSCLKHVNGEHDTCFFCPRCQFFISNDIEKECTAKESCGWCGLHNTCEAGDQLGPFDPKSSCALVPTTDEGHITTNPKWVYPTTSVARDVFLCIGFFCAGIVASMVFAGVCIIASLLYRKFRFKNATSQYDSF